jgi:endonuclease/exonuclease/phosphatase family metal-dependent hydrolase
MLKRLLPLLLVLCVLVCVSAVSANASPLRVLSWNIQFGQGTDGITNYDRIATWLARMNPDLIALCEVPPDGIPTLVTALNARTGRVWNSHFVPKYPGCPEGNLVLSTYNFTALGSYYLSYNRSIAHATINIGGRNVNFFATHLDHTSSALRLTQADELNSWTSNFTTPRIVAGDLNAGNDTPEIIRLLSGYRDSWIDSLNLGAAYAYPDNPVGLNTRTRRWRIDYILFSANAGSLTSLSSNIPDTRDLSNTNVVTTLGTLDDLGVRPSDHNLVVADFNVSTTTPTPTPTPTPIPTPTPTTGTPVLLAREGTNRAVAFHSTLFVTEPFPLSSLINLGTDQRTRIMLFATTVEPGESPTALVVRGTDSRGFTYQLPVEQMTRAPDFSWLIALIVRLPDDQSISGDLSINVELRGAFSNSVRVGIRPP